MARPAGRECDPDGAGVGRSPSGIVGLDSVPIRVIGYDAEVNEAGDVGEDAANLHEKQFDRSVGCPVNYEAGFVIGIVRPTEIDLVACHDRPGKIRGRGGDRLRLGIRRQKQSERAGEDARRRCGGGRCDAARLLPFPATFPLRFSAAAVNQKRGGKSRSFGRRSKSAQYGMSAMVDFRASRCH